MILVDKGVWVDYFTGNKSKQVAKLDSILGNKPIATSALIYTDVLKGFLADKDFDVAKKLFALLIEVNMLSPMIALKSAENARHLRARGISINNTVDLWIATFCIDNKYPLLYKSENFKHFENYLNLRNGLHY